MPSARHPNGEKMYVMHGASTAEAVKSLLHAAGAAKLVPAGASIALKPNLVVSSPASGGATTHPEIVAGAIEYFRDNGHRDIDVIEGSWVGDDTGRAFSACGYRDLAKRCGVGLHDLKKDASTPVATPAGNIRVCNRALSAGFLVNLPVLKGHCQTRMTCALKNMKGCMPDGEKRRFHREGLHRLIAALGTALRPHLILVDGICGDLDFEEGGTPVQADRLLLASDPVKLDTYACLLMGIPPHEVGYLPLAEKYGVGTMRIDAADIVELGQPSATAVRASGEVLRLGRHVQAKEACSACYAGLMYALKRLKDQGELQNPPPLCIGQGWKDKTPPGIGIGTCCRNAHHHIPGCPPTAHTIVEALKHLS